MERSVAGLCIIVVGVLAVCLTAGCEKRQEEIPRAIPITEDGSMELTALTLNLRYENQQDAGARAWRERVVGIVKLLRSEGGEIFGIQEGLHGQVADLRASLPDFAFVGAGRTDGARRGEYAGIFFSSGRFELDQSNHGVMWLSEHPEEVGSKSWGNEIPRIATWVRLFDRASSQALWVVNSHLDHRSQKSREQGVKLIARRLSEMNPDGDPVVWLGDFNATEWNSAIRFIKGDRKVLGPVAGFAGLTETFDELHSGEKKRGTLHFWMRDPKRQWKVDHIFVSKRAQVLEAEVIRSGVPYLSDHFPVKARVRFPSAMLPIR